MTTKLTKLKLIAHKGHKVVIVSYGTPTQNISLECETCQEVLADSDL